MNDINLKEISTEEILQLLKLVSDYIKFIEAEALNATQVKNDN